MIYGILLSAGSGHRFGSDKLTHQLPDGESIAIKACKHLLLGTDKVLAVVRPKNFELIRQFKSIGTDVVVCVDAEQGMGNSLAC
jgi:molybdenum cofactor cytidylyltransferase